MYTDDAVARTCYVLVQMTVLFWFEFVSYESTLAHVSSYTRGPRIYAIDYYCRCLLHCTSLYYTHRTVCERAMFVVWSSEHNGLPTDTSTKRKTVVEEIIAD